jgi:hypothetical protein
MRRGVFYSTDDLQAKKFYARKHFGSCWSLPKVKVETFRENATRKAVPSTPSRIAVRRSTRAARAIRSVSPTPTASAIWRTPLALMRNALSEISNPIAEPYGCLQKQLAANAYGEVGGVKSRITDYPARRIAEFLPWDQQPAPA